MQRSRGDVARQCHRWTACDYVVTSVTILRLRGTRLAIYAVITDALTRYNGVDANTGLLGPLSDFCSFVPLASLVLPFHPHSWLSQLRGGSRFLGGVPFCYDNR